MYFTWKQHDEYKVENKSRLPFSDSIPWANIYMSQKDIYTLCGLQNASLWPHIISKQGNEKHWEVGKVART